MEEVELTRARLTKIWLALLFRLVAGSLLLVVLLYFVNYAFALLHIVVRGPLLVAELTLAFAGQLGVLLLALNGILEAKYPEFRIALVREIDP